MTSHLFIIDTNVLVAGLISSQQGSPTVQVLDAMIDGRLLYILSPALLREYRLVLLRPKLTRLHGLNETDVDQLLTELTANAVWREPSSDAIEPAPDPGDNHLWSPLASEQSSILVTGDHLLLENPRSGNLVITAARCIELMS
jgi:putative PIN family toxin of toxin-antitoxin system